MSDEHKAYHLVAEPERCDACRPTVEAVIKATIAFAKAPNGSDEPEAKVVSLLANALEEKIERLEKIEQRAKDVLRTLGWREDLEPPFASPARLVWCILNGPLPPVT